MQVKDVIRDLKQEGSISVDKVASEAKLKADMHCPACGMLLKNIPSVKRHWNECDAK